MYSTNDTSARAHARSPIDGEIAIAKFLAQTMQTHTYEQANISSILLCRAVRYDDNENSQNCAKVDKWELSTEANGGGLNQHNYSRWKQPTINKIEWKERRIGYMCWNSFSLSFFRNAMEFGSGDLVIASSWAQRICFVLMLLRTSCVHFKRPTKSRRKSQRFWTQWCSRSQYVL